MKKLLVVVDYQNDFVCGALGFPGAEQLEAGIAQEVEATLDEGGLVLFTRDTHEADYLETREGAHLPLPHGIEGTEGHQLYGRLHTYEEHRVPGTMLLDKTTFGSVDIGKKAAGLCGGAPDVIELCGLVTDICVIANAILLHSYFTKAHMRVLAGLCGSGNAAGAQAALDILRGMGMEIVP